MGTPLGLKYIPYTYMDPLGSKDSREAHLRDRNATDLQEALGRLR